MCNIGNVKLSNRQFHVTFKTLGPGYIVNSLSMGGVSIGSLGIDSLTSTIPTSIE